MLELFTDNNFMYFIGAFLPALLYCYVVYRHDSRNLSLRKAANYLIFGYVSIFFLIAMIWIFPNITKPMFLESSGIFDLYYFQFQTKETWATFMFQAFIQIALLEELSKFSLYEIRTALRGKKAREDTLFATMFYVAVVSAGFAVIENIKYVQNALMRYGNQEAESMIIIRAILPSIAHVLFGLLMGYFIALSRLKTTAIKRWGYKLFGLFLAVLFHGYYDYILISGNRITPLIRIKETNFEILTAELVFLLIIGIIMAYIMGYSLSHHSSRHDIIRKKRNLIHQ